MKRIPPKLISSLRTLGLLESEAKVYSALVLFGQAEPKELLDFLDISKPSVYESLRGLEDRGIVVQINTRPALYQAVDPKIALKLLTDTYLDASEEASGYLDILQKERVKERPSGTLWSIYGSTTIEYKVADMLRNAKESVQCVLPERYLHYLEEIAGKGIKISFLLISDDNGIKERIEKVFSQDDIRYRIMSASEMLKMSAFNRAHQDQKSLPEYSEVMSQFDYTNLTTIIVDDSEFLYVPPVKGDTVSALNTNNKTMIMGSQMFFLRPGLF
ncbi:hypothetical protein CUJ83_01550 [Methanocella sp. CWC-04]|uniref:Sugar-specific transcriptional regulator TrmB n=1 Tax=Methanooceanicella nereidis TaxID=2052831 RepID=A0AAP2RAP4_9EURY|nr:helix-turn-helix domain-containing protein [Methanocella sp. CWC-04]MCD1293679.1 hypothetical protein [Methanocella sp. CWC-04]